MNGTVVQLDVLCAGIVAIGFTVIVTVNTVPNKQLPEVGVTTYVAVTADAVVFVSVLVTVAVPVPDAPPESAGSNVGAAHEYVVPAGIVPVGVYENARAEQADPVCETIVATGLIVTVTVNTAPVVQLPDVGVTLYVAVDATDRLFARLSFNEALPVPDAPPVRPVPRVGVLHA